MMRSFFIYLSKAAWARKFVTGWSPARRMASRFIAGDTLDEALAAVKALNAKGINATLDLLGEHTETPDDARRSAAEIIHIFETIASAGLRANVSIKLTQLGLALDHDLCVENLATVLEAARKMDTFMRIDMEDSAVTKTTIDLMLQVRQKGYTNVGIVIQSYLYRSDKDIAELAAQGVPVRLCKGAYKEPATVAYPKKVDVDAAYDRMAAALMDGSKKLGFPRLSADGKTPPLPGLATHDPNRIAFAKRYAEINAVPKDAIEFQMLYGIRRDLQEQLAAEGYPVRVYVPYGTQWYPYFMRRLAERPANVWFILSNFFRK